MTNLNLRNNMLSELHAYKYPPAVSYDRNS